MDDLIQQSLLKKIASVQVNHDLGVRHPLRLGGKARFYAEVTDAASLCSAVKAAVELDLPYYVVGQQTNLIFGTDFPGLVIKNQAKSSVFIEKHSQALVESGQTLNQIVNQAANRGFSGLLPFIGFKGSLGGALYRNLNSTSQARTQESGESSAMILSLRQNQELISSVKALTVMLPPTKSKPEPTIVRYGPEWLDAKSDQFKTRLNELKQGHELAPQPIILAAQLQFTKLRPDEIAARMQQAIQISDYSAPKSNLAWGPLFQNPVGASACELLVGSGAAKLELAGFKLDPKNPNFCLATKYSPKRGQSESPVLLRFEQFISAVNQKVSDKYGQLLPLALEWCKIET